MYDRKGECLLDQAHLVDLKLEQTAPSAAVVVTGRMAIVASKTKKSVGPFAVGPVVLKEGEPFSAKTVRLAKELMLSLEADMASFVFAGGASSQAGQTKEEGPETSRPITGLGGDR